MKKSAIIFLMVCLVILAPVQAQAFNPLDSLASVFESVMNFLFGVKEVEIPQVEKKIEEKPASPVISNNSTTTIIKETPQYITEEVTKQYFTTTGITEGELNSRLTQLKQEIGTSQPKETVVNRTYVSKQNDSIVDSLSRSNLSLTEGGTFTDASVSGSFSGSANLSELTFGANELPLGSEEITNGSFTGSANSWTLGTGWSYGSNSVTHTNGNIDELTQTGTLTEGSTYAAQFDISGTIGTVTARLDGGTNEEDVAAGAGTITFTGIWNEDDGIIIGFEPSTDFNGTIDNVSVKEISSPLSRTISIGTSSGSNLSGTDLVLQAGAGSGGTNGIIKLADSDSGFKANLDISELTEDQTFTFPDQSGTFMMTSEGGFLGVGTTSPSYALDVQGNGASDGIRYISGSNHPANFYLVSNHPSINSRSWLLSADNTDFGTFEIRSSNAAQGDAYSDGTTRFLIDRSGNVGIGSTSPFATLAVNPIAGAASNQFVVGSSTATNFIIKNSGLVGIATTSPWRTLSVTGTVAFDGLTGSVGAGSLCLSSTKQVVYNSASDACLSSLRSTKHDIATSTIDALNTILKLEPVSFVYNEGDNRTRYGFIAEDTAAVDDRLATHDAEGNISGIDDRAIISIVVKAIKELSEKLKDLVVNSLTAEIVYTKQLCIEDLCINKSQLQQIINSSLGSVMISEIMAPELVQEATTTATTTEETAAE